MTNLSEANFNFSNYQIGCIYLPLYFQAFNFNFAFLCSQFFFHLLSPSPSVFLISSIWQVNGSSHNWGHHYWLYDYHRYLFPCMPCNSWKPNFTPKSPSSDLQNIVWITGLNYRHFLYLNYFCYFFSKYTFFMKCCVNYGSTTL